MALPTITNIVVLMLENRSYDNVLGMLYSANNAFPYDAAPEGQTGLMGLSGAESNDLPNPPGGSITVMAAVGDSSSSPPLLPTMIPAIDPGEGFADMAQQILGLDEPDTTTNPYTGPAGTYGAMGGFVANYLRQSRDGTPSSPAQIMMYLTPEMMPTTAFLANNFMVCDGWFGSVPSNTWANRLFSVCAASGTWTAGGTQYSYIDDLEYFPGEHGAMPVFLAEKRLVLPSVFSQLDAVLGVVQKNARGAPFPSWKVYFHDYSNIDALLQYVSTQFHDPASLNLGQYDTSDFTSATTLLANKQFTTFQQDLAAGTLAPFTLIEPRYCNNFPLGGVQGNEVQSNHPGVQAYVNLPGSRTSPQIDAQYGEQLLLDVYTQLRGSTYWWSTLLIVVYDEHGGCYDHVPPITTMIPPSPTNPASYVGFDFTVSGPRVPALIVSPFAFPGSTLRAPAGKVFDHTSIIKTVWECFDLNSGPHAATSLNDRDGAAASVLDGLSEIIVNGTGLPNVT